MLPGPAGRKCHTGGSAAAEGKGGGGGFFPDKTPSLCLLWPVAAANPSWDLLRDLITKEISLVGHFDSY